MNNQIKLGPSGNGDWFYGEGFKSSIDMPAWLNQKGLNAYEYSFGRGFSAPVSTIAKIGEESVKNNVLCSVHAPYFINFANTEDEMIEKSFGYVIKSLNYLRAIRGEHCVFHPACMGKLKREEAISLTTSRLNELVSKVYETNLDDMFLCPETMGKSAQIGTYKEIVNFCTIDKLFVPCFDFGHINALEGGTLKSEKDFKKVFDYAFSKLDEDKVKKCHIHFSKIQFGDKGEIRHLDFSDEIYGPNYEALANVINEYNLSPHMICESSSKMSEDALVMKKYLMTSQ